MKLEKMGIVAFLLVLVVSMSYPAVASEPCQILTSGNKYYGKDNSKAIDIYRTIEDIDKLGKDRCTASIYATIGTIYKMKGDDALKSSNYEKATVYYKLSLKYNRAFANALLCSEGNCNASEMDWKEDSFWNR